MKTHKEIHFGEYARLLDEFEEENEREPTTEECDKLSERAMKYADEFLAEYGDWVRHRMKYEAK